MKVERAKIFVVFPSFHDTESIYTIKNAYETAKYPELITIGTHLMYGSMDILDTFKSFVRKYPQYNIRYSEEQITKYNILDKLGVGYGRRKAFKHYENELYILQIDSHTWFAKDWDQDLINLLNDAKDYMQNDKVILTAYAGAYKIDKSKNRIVDKNEVFKYQFLNHQKQKNIDYKDSLHYYMPEWITNYPNPVYQKFVPATKFAANFSFGEINVNSYLPKNTMFMEEEIIQTINLLDDGYKLVHPNVDKPIICHLYIDQDQPRSRALITDFLDKLETKYYLDAQIENYLTFINKKTNKKKIKNYENYSMCRIIGSDYIDNFVPII